MRSIAFLAPAALAAAASIAQAHTTRDLLFRCSQDEVTCAAKIRDGLWRLENPPPGRPVIKLCPPHDLSDKNLVEQVAGWINEQSPGYDNLDEDDSIAAALTALYPCGGIKGLNGN